MTKPGEEVSGDEKVGEEPKLAKETIQDLDTSPDQAKDVKGGRTMRASDDPNECCEAGTM